MPDIAKSREVPSGPVPRDEIPSAIVVSTLIRCRLRVRDHIHNVPLHATADGR